MCNVAHNQPLRSLTIVRDDKLIFGRNLIKLTAVDYMLYAIYIYGTFKHEKNNIPYLSDIPAGNKGHCFG